MCMLILGADVLGVRGWWLPLGSITKLEQRRTSAGGWVVEWRLGLLCLVGCLIGYYWLVYMCGEGLVFADVRSDVLGSGGREVGRVGRVDCPRRYGWERRGEVKKQPCRRMGEWRRAMSLWDRRQRAATKVVLGCCYLDKDRTGRPATGAAGDRVVCNRQSETCECGVT
jgi:hypothetical protein